MPDVPQSFRMPTTKILHVGEGVAVAEVGRLCVVVWRGGVTERPFEHQRNGLAQVVADNPDGAGFLCIIEPSATPPNDKLRRASTDMVAAHGNKLKCVAVVIEGEGFRAAITRGVIGGMALLLPRRTPSTTFAKIPDALAWMQQHVTIESPVRVIIVVDKLRVHLGPVFPSPE